MVVTIQKSFINKYTEQFKAERYSEPPDCKIIFTCKCAFNLKILAYSHILCHIKVKLTP